MRMFSGIEGATAAGQRPALRRPGATVRATTKRRREIRITSPCGFPRERPDSAIQIGAPAAFCSERHSSAAGPAEWTLNAGKPECRPGQLQPLVRLEYFACPLCRRLGVALR